MSSRTSSRGTHNSTKPSESAQKVTPLAPLGRLQGITGSQKSERPVGVLEGATVVGTRVGEGDGGLVGAGAGASVPTDDGDFVIGAAEGDRVVGHGPHSPSAATPGIKLRSTQAGENG